MLPKCLQKHFFEIAANGKDLLVFEINLRPFEHNWNDNIQTSVSEVRFSHDGKRLLIQRSTLNLTANDRKSEINVFTAF